MRHALLPGRAWLLAWNDTLAAAAHAHSADMAAQRYLNHTGKDGRMVAERAAAAGYQASRIGENIAAGQASADEVVQGWLDSPGHCANLMNEDFSEMGAAYAVNRARAPARIYWTQVLGTPRRLAR
ncbi:CAP domain-containing protein [Massilia sp. H-1]|nr:CAP domain-containing protein [Massilia sp. H-1]